MQVEEAEVVILMEGVQLALVEQEVLVQIVVCQLLQELQIEVEVEVEVIQDQLLVLLAAKV